MKIKNVTINPQALGVIEFQIIWECSACGAKNLLTRRGSLLAAHEVKCGCGNRERYQYDPSAELSRLLKSGMADAIDNAIKDKIKMIETAGWLRLAEKGESQNDNAAVLGDEPIFLLGQDFVFAVNTYLGKGLAE
jgi:hypothetical protein